MYQYIMDLSILKDTNITGDVYSQDSVVFFVIASAAFSRNRRGVAIFYKYSIHFTVESHQ